MMGTSNRGCCGGGPGKSFLAFLPALPHICRHFPGVSQSVGLPIHGSRMTTRQAGRLTPVLMVGVATSTSTAPDLNAVSTTWETRNEHHARDTNHHGLIARQDGLLGHGGLRLDYLPQVGRQIAVVEGHTARDGFQQRGCLLPLDPPQVIQGLLPCVGALSFRHLWFRDLLPTRAQTEISETQVGVKTPGS